MSTSTLLTNGIFLLLGAFIGYFFKGVAIKNASTTKIETKIETAVNTSPASDTSVVVLEKSEDVDSLKIKKNKAEVPLPEQAEPNPNPTDFKPSLTQLPSAELCFTDEKALSKRLSLFAEKMEKDSLWYNNREPEKLLDCSGIFHRVANYVKSTCDSYQYPDISATRDTRALAGWYYDQNNLAIIHDPMAQRNLIKPGAVLFFGKSGQVYNDLTIERLRTPIPNHVIMHVGVVTEVTKDKEGNVNGYVMFHGRRPGVIAKRSHYHKIQPPRQGYPILGNWNQQWVAISYIMTPKMES